LGHLSAKIADCHGCIVGTPKKIDPQYFRIAFSTEGSAIVAGIVGKQNNKAKSKHIVKQENE
jgi:hypothetical protein